MQQPKYKAPPNYNVPTSTAPAKQRLAALLAQKSKAATAKNSPLANALSKLGSKN